MNLSSVVPSAMVPGIFCELSIIARGYFFLVSSEMDGISEGEKKCVTQISRYFCISSPHQCCSLLSWMYHLNFLTCIVK